MSGFIDSDQPPDAHLAGFIEPRTQFFVDGREGVDRWGRERKRLWACGTGWDDYVCPAWVEESCPGDKNKNVRSLPNRNTTCDLRCGACGGGGRAETMAYCGWERAAGLFKVAMNEMGGSLRLDRWTAGPTATPEPWTTPFMPSVEWRDKAWYERLNESAGGVFPWLATSFRTASPGKSSRETTPLRKRFGDYQGKLLVHGLVKDDVLDEVWDRRGRVMGWCLAEGVDCMITPQFSYYGDDQTCMHLYNANRIFRWYCEAVEMGFPMVGLDWPPWNSEWEREELVNFVLRSGVKLVCPSYQTIIKRQGLSGFYIDELRFMDKVLPPDVSFLCFGLTTVQSYMQVLLTLPHRNVAFSSSAPYAKAALFKLEPEGDSAPKRFAKADVFTYNVNYHLKLINKALGAQQRRVERLARTAAARQRAAAA